MKKIIFALSAAVVLVSCGGNETTPAVETPKQDSTSQACIYSYDSSSTEIVFGAFKFTEKKEVKGSFLKFTVDNTKESDQPYKVLEGAEFKIDIEGMSTKDIGRDKNIKTSFFYIMDSTAFLTGKLRSVEMTGYNSDSKKDTLPANVLLKMNGVEKEIKLQLEINDDYLKLTGTINLDDFKAQKALAALSEACKDLHKGPDGVSKTWNEVNIYVSTKLKNSCK